MSRLDFNMLPEDCASTICSLTSPEDACRLSMVSSSFRSAAGSDLVWERFLPSDYRDILARTLKPLKFSSKKELFFLFSESILLDGGKQSFALEKSSGRKSFTLSARGLSILHGNESNHWCWKSLTESRFAEAAELKTTNRIEIEGKIRTQMLSPNTTYGAHLIMKISSQSFGLDSIPSEISVNVGDNVVTNTACLRPKDETKQQMQSLFCANRMQMLKMRVNEGDERLPVERKDGWMEISLGEFFSGEVDEEITMSLMEIKGHQLKGGLIIEGIEVRPKS
ncbi:unnamed protein product [Coffea canephora]|uniref:F-box domain-containing protein n=1 Tax=Coffea canephora TaxID=49390 RepID=A0A068V9M8_COFCA|nr:unnamed protein product [Coffea canephora]